MNRIKSELHRLGGSFHLRDWNLLLRALAAGAFYWFWLLAAENFLSADWRGAFAFLLGLFAAGVGAHLIILKRAFMLSSFSSAIFVGSAAIYGFLSERSLLLVVGLSIAGLVVLFWSYRLAFRLLRTR